MLGGGGRGEEGGKGGGYKNPSTGVDGLLADSMHDCQQGFCILHQQKFAKFRMA